MATDGDRGPVARLRERANAFYAWAFMPPSVTDEAFEAAAPSPAGADPSEYGGFDIAEWLEASGPHVAADAAAEPEADPDPVATGAEGFDFAGWLAAGGEFDPADVSGVEEPASRSGPAAEGAEPAVPSPASPLPRPHPVKAATFALFLAVAALAALTMAGYLPTLGPAGGFAG